MGYRYHNANKLTTTFKNGVLETQSIYGFLRMMSKRLRDDRDATPLVLWDGHPQWRYDKFPDYKSDRERDQRSKDMRASFRVSRPFILHGFKLLGVKQITYSTGEADDLAGYFSQALTGGEIELVTGDSDWLGLVRPGVSWHNPIKGDTVTSDTFYDYTGFQTGKAFYEGKALMGDASDSLPPVGGIGEKTAPVFLAKHQSVEDFFARYDSGEYVTKSKVEQRLAGEGREIFRLNYEIMNLLDTPKPKSEDLVIEQGQFDADKVRNYLATLGFVSLLKDFSNFIQPFEARA